MSKTQFLAILLCALLVATAPGFANQSKHFREGGGEGYTDVTFDDAWIKYSPASDINYGTQSYNGINVSPDYSVTHICIKDLFTEIPQTSGGNDVEIVSATLHLTRYSSGSSSNVLSIYRTTTNWVPDSAGTNETDVTGLHAEKSSSTGWASGGWSSSDYDSSACSTGNWVSNYNEECQIDVTNVIAAIYEAGTNYGFVITADGTITGRASEQSTASQRPSLEVTYNYPGTTYTLTVNSGSGDGDYSATTVVDITADAAPSGQEFDEWTGDTSGIADVNDGTTTITMPAADAEITATYTDKTWTLTVNNGSGDGDYVVATVVDISADAAPSGQDFDEWAGDTEGIANVNSSSTTLTMPYADAEITARYTDKTWTLTVNSGSGDGDYAVDTEVPISADAAPSGQEFDEWVGDTAGIADVSDPTTTLTMPYADAEVTATYTDETWTLTVNSGTGDGDYAAATVVDITADTPPQGQEFDQWTGDVSGIADVTDPTTTITMPAADAEITATYVDIVYSLTVNSGTGDGAYAQGTVVGIAADAAPSGQEFDEWTGDTSGIANVAASSTTITMPGSDAEITATYTDVIWTLTVNSGSGDGTYVVGTQVDITADAAPSGQQFDEWVGDTDGIANVSSSSTTLTMPYADAEVTATYKAISNYILTVNSGSGDGNYAPSAVVDITADTAPSGMLFDAWTGDTSGIADVNDPSTTLTMPAADAEVTATYTHVVADLVSRYTFDIDARDTYGSNDGTLTNGASVTNDGTRGKVLSLDGTNDYVALPKDNMAAGRSEVTLSMWIKPDEWVTSNTIYDEYAETEYWQFTIREDEFMTRDTSTGTTGSRNNDLTMPSASTGSWHHLAFVYSVSAGKKEIWYDGAISATSDVSIDTLTSDRDGVGIGYACDGDYYDGLIDDVRLYSRALNATEIAYLAETALYTLTVNSGSGDGSYIEGQVVDISADAAPSGQEFDEWTGDTSGIGSLSSASTTITMPGSDAEITATYTDVKYTLTVNSGTGDGDYTVDTVVDIVAGAAPSGYQFDQWTGDTSTIADVNAATTTITMPPSDAEITATYELSAGTYALTVNNGTGDGSYNENDVVDIGADAAASGKFFDKWTGDTTGIADINDPTTTLTMPASDAEITATYADVADSLVSRYTFDIDARDTYGSNDGTLVNGASVTTDGTRGKVLSLDGADDYVDLPSGNMTAGRSELTLAMWIKPDEWVSSNTIYDEYANTEYWQFTIREDEYMTRDTSTGLTGSRGNDLVLPTVGTGQWHHLAFVYSVSGDSKAIYYDGALHATSDVSIDTLTVDRDGARIGYPCDGEYYDGLIDDVRLYSRALSAAEISLLAEETQYTLTVNSGSGDGDYVQGEVVDISADAAASGYTFDDWVGDTSGIADVNDPTTTLTMPAADQEITATYVAAATYSLTVNSGSGDGNYTDGTIVDITADAAPSGKQFDDWIGDTSGIADVNDPTTTLTMPAANQEVTATYKDATQYTLTVNSGSGDGDYLSGTVVDIDADSAPSGKVFDKWIGDTAGIANLNNASTTLTMPAADQEITATYEDAGSGPSISSTSGTWSQGSTVTISGSGFGDTGKEEPIKFDDFEGGVVGASLATGGWSVTADNGPDVPEYSNTRSWSGSKSGYADISMGGDSAAYKAGLGAKTIYASFMFYYTLTGSPSTHKFFRVNANDGPNIYTSYPNIMPQDFAGGSFRMTVCPEEESGGKFWADYMSQIPSSSWQRIELWFKISDPAGSSNGQIEYWRGLNQETDWSGVNRSSGVSSVWQLAMMPFYFGNGGGGELWYDDAYLSYSKARVEVGNASTWSGCTRREIQGVTSWASSSITIKVNEGAFSDVTDGWLYVYTNGGQVNSAGYSLH